jgi:O-methyltransferase
MSNRQIKKSAKRLIRPLRTLLGKAVQTNWVANMSLTEKAALFIAADKIEGDYLEFGVFQGGSFSESYLTFQKVFKQRIRVTSYNTTSKDASERQDIWDRMRFFAFDSFEGLPELRGIDKGTRDFAKGQYASGIDEFMNSITRDGVPSERVTCVPGWFEQTCVPATIQRYNIRKAAMIWIDCDLYHSTKSVLNFITPLLQDGTVVIFDDWYSFRGNPRLGEQKAFSEWKKTVVGFTLSEYQKEGAWRVAFLASSTLEPP